MDHTTSVARLRTQYRQLRRCYFIMMLLAVLALVLYFVRPVYALAVLGGSLVFHLLLVRRRAKAYVSGFTSLAAEITLDRHLENAGWPGAPVLTEAQVRRARMIPCNPGPGGAVCHQGGTGSYHGRSVCLGDVTLAHTFTENNRRRHTFTIGCWVTVELDEDTGLNCRFLGSGIVPEDSLKEMLWVEEDLKRCPPPAQMNQSWRVVRTEDSALPGDGFLKQLDRLSRKTEGQVAVCVQGRQLHVLLVGQILAQKVSSRVAPGDGFARADLLPALDEALALSDRLAQTFQTVKS